MKIVELLEDSSYDIGSLRSALSVRQGQAPGKAISLDVIKNIAKDLGFSITDMATLKLFKDKIDPTGDVIDIDDQGRITLNNPNPEAPIGATGKGPNVDAMAKGNSKISPVGGSKT
jgi:hypothetical protein